MPEKVGTIYKDDPTGQRTGWVLEESVTNTILKGCQDAKAFISVKKVEEKKPMTIIELLEILDLLKAGVMIGYPCYYGLPEWEPCRILLEDKGDLLTKEMPNQEVRIIINLSFIMLIRQLYGTLVRNMKERNFYQTILEKMKRLKLSVNSELKAQEHRLESQSLIKKHNRK
jgi:hypothetical protein